MTHFSGSFWAADSFGGGSRTSLTGSQTGESPFFHPSKISPLLVIEIPARQSLNQSQHGTAIIGRHGTI